MKTFDPINFGSKRFSGRFFFFKKNNLSNAWICLVGEFFTFYDGKSPLETTIWEYLGNFFQAS